MSEAVNQSRINGLGDLIAAAQNRGELPVSTWDPPYCGDIGMSIRADGQWMFQGSPIGRARLVKLFSRILRRDEDGKYYLVTPVEKVDVAVEDAPFMAVELDVTGSDREQVLTFRTNVDDVVVVDRAHPLMFRVEAATGGLKPYIRVRGRLEALVTRALYYDLVDLAVPGSSVDGFRSAFEPSLGVVPSEKALGIWSKGTWFKLTDNVEEG